MELYRRYISQLFEKLVTCRRFAQIRIPTEANAAESGLDPQEYIRRMDRAYDVDYAAVRAACEHAAAQFAGASRVAVRTDEGCVLQLELTGRTWLTDAGDGDLPCGEIYIAPVEAKTNGDVFFGTLYLEGEAYTDVTLQITNGEITGSSCEAVAAHFAGLPRENRIVCELGLGMNPNVTDLCGYTLLDEKMAGTFHIAVGANTMFGGENRATDHGDFVGRGEVEVLAAGVRYLRIEGACYVGIGCLFLLYGFYRAVKRPGMSVVLTVISLGTRVVLAYLLSAVIGVTGIWWSVPIGWFLADVTGVVYYFIHKEKLLHFGESNLKRTES